MTTTTTTPALSTSLSSLSTSQTLPDITRTYKQSSQLFLTRRVAEALETLQPIIERLPQQPDTSNSASVAVALADTSDEEQNDHALPLAPIATASRGARVKVWSLYISILNAVVEMGEEAGREAFGVGRWRALCAKARDGGAWEEVQRVGYSDREGAVDADVVANLATLLLAHAASQRLTQQKLEAYLAACGRPGETLGEDVAERMKKREGAGKVNGRGTGTSTPRDLGSRLKILEIFTLHVLPRNGEWEYAREVIGMSEVLDEERREAFLQALQNIQDEKNLDEKKEEELQKQREQQLDEARRKQEYVRRKDQAAAGSEVKRSTERDKESKAVKTREGDASVSRSKQGEPSRSNSAKAGTANGTATAPKSSNHLRKTSKNLARQPDRRMKPNAQSGFYQRAMILGGSMQHSILTMVQNLRKHPVMLIRMLAFVIALIMALARRDVRDRINRIRDASWDKVKRTVGMGVKVSYI